MGEIYYEKNKGLSIERYNLSTNPQIFVDNNIINKEFCEFLNVSEDYLKTGLKIKTKGCDCKGGCC